MNKKELYNQFEALEELLSNKDIPFILEAINLFSPILNNLKTNPKDLLVETNQGQSVRRAINVQIQEVIKKEKNLKYRKIIVESTKLENGLQNIKAFMQVEHLYYVGFLTEIEEKLEGFLNSYEQHTRSYSTSTCLSLSVWASELSISIESSKQILKSILVMNNKGTKKDDLCRLDLYLSNVQSLKDFAIKLDAISEIYSELLSLYGLSESDNPIIIEHLENGSLWLKIAGHTLAATLLTSILSLATDYYQDNFTTSGKLQQLPVAVQVANDLLKITDKLEKDGIDTKEIKMNIESATRKISKKLDILLSDQPMVEINNKKHDIGNNLSKKLIEQNKIRQIENKK